ncbi:MAG: hypothetical protein AAF590_05375 [Pseudomonadota bacterium]
MLSIRDGPVGRSWSKGGWIEYNIYDVMIGLHPAIQFLGLGKFDVDPRVGSVVRDALIPPG